MPIYDPSYVEYGITTGHIQIVTDGGQTLPAYWAHPNTGNRFPAVALLHDWWGITPFIRRMANLFAQSGYYVVVPDLFDGQAAATPEEAMTLVRNLGDGGYTRVDMALSVLERHHNTNGDVAAVGLGMGGSLAFEAALKRQDLEASVAFYGIPHRFLGHFANAHTPILALYGSKEPHVSRPVIDLLQRELAKSSLAHEVVILEGVGRNFFSDEASEAQREAGRLALKHTFSFLEKYLERPIHPPAKQVY